MSRFWYRARKFITHNVLHADDTPHQIALGAAIAMVIAIMPFVGIQTVLSIAIAALFRANKAVCVAVVWASNPITTPPLLWASYHIGRWVLPPGWLGNEEGLHRLFDMMKTGSALELGFWREVFWVLIGAGAELWVGTFIVGVALAIPTYFAMRWAVGLYRERRRQKILRRGLFRSQLQAARAVRQTEPA